MKFCNKCGLHEGEWLACEEPDCGELVEGKVIHTLKSIDENCDHDWEENEEREPVACKKCGLSFVRYGKAKFRTPSDDDILF